MIPELHCRSCTLLAKAAGHQVNNLGRTQLSRLCFLEDAFLNSGEHYASLNPSTLRSIE